MNSNVRLSAILVVLVVVWMATGILFGDKESTTDESAAEQVETRFSVQAVDSMEQVYSSPVHIRARTEAERTVNVAAEIDGLIESTPIVEGERVKRGAILCELKDEDRVVRLRQAEAQLSKAKLDYDAALKLKGSGFQSRSQIAGAKAALALAEAEKQKAELSLAHLNVKAPFDGILQRQLKDAGDFIQRGNACAQLLELDPIIVAGNVNENDIRQLSVGDRAQVRLGTQAQYEGRVRFLSRLSDTQTKTFRVEVEVANADYAIAAGLTADIVAKAKPVQAHLVSSSLLILLDKGEIGLRSVDDNNRVQIHKVNVVGDDQHGIWVTGLPPKLKLITVGQEYVINGQIVDVVEQAARK